MHSDRERKREEGTLQRTRAQQVITISSSKDFVPRSLKVEKKEDLAIEMGPTDP